MGGTRDGGGQTQSCSVREGTDPGFLYMGGNVSWVSLGYWGTVRTAHPAEWMPGPD
jgi:hypothetical protein